MVDPPRLELGTYGL